MKAAVVDVFDRLPRYGDFPEPQPCDGEVMVNVRAAALSQLVRAQAAGKHYSSGTPPFVPGVDGVGTLADGRRVYFAFPRGPVGAMAQRVVVPAANVVQLPDAIDDATAAAIANPGMSSWASLCERVAFKPGESVLINGATGASGRLAIRVARHLGAARVVVTGRNPAHEAALRALGADQFIALQQPAEALTASFRDEIAHGIDVVLDYLWGPSAEAFINAATGHGNSAAAPRIRFVNIGSLGGANIALNASALRSSGLELTGSGLGSLSHAALIRSIASLMGAIKMAGLSIETDTLPLSEVEQGWSRGGERRLVFTL